MFKGFLKKQKKPKLVLKSFSNVQESLKTENTVSDSVNQWEEVKTNLNEKLDQAVLDERLSRRMQELKKERRRIFLQNEAKLSEEKKLDLVKRRNITEQLKAERRNELKKREIALRENSLLG